ncbi:MAG: DNA polymerase Y family protein, partial [Pseudomonadota bacterium]
WRLSHGDSSVTAFTLGFQQPLRDASRMLELLKQRLERLELPAAACDLGLKAEGLLPWSGGPVPLLTESSPDADGAFLDRLRARLGADAVTGIGMVADHRPERAMRSCVPGSSPLPLTFPPRPLWLLPRPLPLEVRAGRPWRDGPLSLEGERERIEVGWWDGEPVRRDYFVARAVTGERLWIFLDRRRGPRWFLHGLFG